MGCKDIEVRKSEFVAKTQFLFYKIRDLLFVFGFTMYAKRKRARMGEDGREEP